MTHAGQRRFDQVVFDLDGTLADTQADLTASTNHVRGVYGLPPLEPEAVHPLVGEGARRLVERALGACEPPSIDEAVRAFLAHYEAHLLDATVLYPGIVEAIDTLTARGVTLTVLTNKPERLAHEVLRGLHVGDRFGAVIGGDTLPVRKPDPTGVLMLRQRFGSSATRTLLVGDSLVDFETAANAPVPFCGVSWGFVPARLRAAAPPRMIDTAADLVAVVSGAVA